MLSYEAERLYLLRLLFKVEFSTCSSKTYPLHFQHFGLPFYKFAH